MSKYFLIILLITLRLSAMHKVSFRNQTTRIEVEDIAHYVCFQILKDSNDKNLEKVLTYNLQRRKKPKLYPELTEMRNRLIRSKTYNDLQTIEA